MTTYENVPTTWPDGYFPLWHRLTGEVNKAYGRTTAKVEPSDRILDYITHEPVVDGVVAVEPFVCMIRLLAQPGDYTVTFVANTGDTYVHEVTVIDPVESAEAKPFRDGKPLWRRPGKYDQFIIDENPYQALVVGDVVLDCGAHIGTFTRDALNRGAKSVVSFEPEPMNHMLLARNTSGMPVTRHQVAISGENGSMPLYLSWTADGHGSGGNSLYRTQSQRPVVRVHVRSFREVLLDVKPNTVKLDIKDAEYKIDWATLPWPDETISIAMEADVDFIYDTVNPSLNAHGFTAVRLPNRSGWKRSVAIWQRG